MENSNSEVNMSQNVMITGAGKAVGLGFNMVLRYLEAGDNVVATVRKPCAELEELKTKYGNKLTILTMDIGSTESVQSVAEELSKTLSHLDLLINNKNPLFIKGFIVFCH